jgi:hypothetical protein
MKLIPSLVATSALVLVSLGAALSSSGKKVSVLIVTGQNNHDWVRSTPIIKGLLEETGRFDVSVSTSPSKEAPDDAWNDWSPDFKNYDVVLSDYNGKIWPDPVKADFVSYLRPPECHRRGPPGLPSLLLSPELEPTQEAAVVLLVGVGEVPGCLKVRLSVRLF